MDLIFAWKVGPNIVQILNCPDCSLCQPAVADGDREVCVCRADEPWSSARIDFAQIKQRTERTEHCGANGARSWLRRFLRFSPSLSGSVRERDSSPGVIEQTPPGQLGAIFQRCDSSCCRLSDMRAHAPA